MVMNKMNKEVYYVQNPALGAAILWRFICGYYRKDSHLIPFPLLFIVLPIIFREDLREVIESTQKKSGLSKVSEKLFKGKNTNELYTINNTAIDLRKLSLDSIRIGIACGLFNVNMETALVYPLTETSKRLSVETNKILAASEKLGAWCSEMTLIEICNWLKVRF